MFKLGSHIIKNPFILAPMAGVSQMPFRVLALEMGASLAPTELISSKGLFHDSTRTKAYLTHDVIKEKPFWVQLFGGEAESMALAAEKAVMMGADIIDINMGCPVKKVTKSNAGSALLCDINRASLIVSSMLKRVNYAIPITAKIRSGWDSNNLNFLAVGKALEDAGISAISFHARTRAQGYSGMANWEQIGLLKSHLNIPVIGNGDIKNIDDAKRMLTKTSCDAVMIGRAALGNPFLFRDLVMGYEQSISNTERLEIIKRHLYAHLDLGKTICDIEKRDFCELRALKSFRSHLIWYSKGLINGALFRSKIIKETSLTKVLDLIENFFNKASIALDNDDGDNIDYAQAFG